MARPRSPSVPSREAGARTPGTPLRVSAGLGWQAPRGHRAARGRQSASPGRKPLARRMAPPGSRALGWAGRRDLRRRRFLAPGTAAGPATSPPGQERAGGAAAPGQGAELEAPRTHRPGPGSGLGTWQPPRPPEKFPRSWLRTGRTMNVFRILGDLSHLLAMILLLGKIWRSSAARVRARVPGREVGVPRTGGGGRGRRSGAAHAPAARLEGKRKPECLCRVGTSAWGCLKLSS